MNSCRGQMCRCRGEIAKSGSPSPSVFGGRCSSIQTWGICFCSNVVLGEGRSKGTSAACVAKEKGERRDTDGCAMSIDARTFDHVPSAATQRLQLSPPSPSCGSP